VSEGFLRETLLSETAYNVRLDWRLFSSRN
jgi:hypothetical protein